MTQRCEHCGICQVCGARKETTCPHDRASVSATVERVRVVRGGKVMEVVRPKMETR